MEASKILTADVLDILFEHMNKDYGAYKLRKGYNGRLRLALIITGITVLFVTGGVWLSRLSAHYRPTLTYRIDTINLSKVSDPVPKIPPPLPPPHVDPPRIQMYQDAPPRIVDQPDPKKEVHTQDELNDATLGLRNQDGIKDPTVINPPRTDGDNKVISTPNEDSNQGFIPIEKEAAFPGGDAAWHEYVLRTINQHMDELQDDGKSGTCEVQFIVDKDGVVSDVKALSMEGTKLAEIAVNAIRRGPHWVPAQQNGRMVKAFRRQKITFQLPEP